MSSHFEREGAVNEYIECECGAPQHIVRMTLDSGEEKYEPTLTFDVQLRHGNFLFRLRNAFLYLFLNDLAQWDGSLLGVEAVEKVERVILNFKRSHRAWRLRKENVCSSCEGQGGISECNECGLCAFCRRVGCHSPECLIGHGLASVQSSVTGGTMVTEVKNEV